MSSGSVTIGGRASRPASAYHDGRYIATGHYTTPGGAESILVTLELTDGTVTGAQVRTEALSPTARQFQDQFRTHVAAQVVGRKLSSLSVSRVAGASLTSIGFNDALAKVKSDAGV